MDAAILGSHVLRFSLGGRCEALDVLPTLAVDILVSDGDLAAPRAVLLLLRFWHFCSFRT